MFNNYNILIVDNDLEIAQKIKSYLNSLGFNIVGITSCYEETSTFLSKERVDLLLIDIDINGRIDGIQCCDIIYNEYKIPSIFLTNYDDCETLFLIENSNSYGYFLKSSKKEVLKVNIMLVLSKLKKENSSVINRNINLKNEFSFCTKESILYHKQSEVNLTKQQRDLIHILSKYKGNNISYEMIFDYVWRDKRFCINKIRGSVFRLKKKIPTLQISNYQEIGYKIE